MTGWCLPLHFNITTYANIRSTEHRPSWPKRQRQRLTLDLSSVHQGRSVWLWVAALGQPFGSVGIQSAMCRILDTLVPWWHLARVTSGGRGSLAWCAFWGLEQLWKSPHISITTKVKLFNTTCVTILLYGCESLVISQDMENKINAFATSCYCNRVMLNIKRIDHVLNTTVYSMTNTVPLIHLVRHRQLKFLGHILRMSKEELARRYALYIPTIGKRRSGRPRTSYLNYVQRLHGDDEGAMQEQKKERKKKKKKRNDYDTLRKSPDFQHQTNIILCIQQDLIKELHIDQEHAAKSISWNL